MRPYVQAAFRSPSVRAEQPCLPTQHAWLAAGCGLNSWLRSVRRDRPYDDMPDEAEEARRKSRRKDSSPAAARSATQQLAAYATAISDGQAVESLCSAPYRAAASLPAGALL